jgi:hypothetical protein
MKKENVAEQRQHRRFLARKGVIAVPRSSFANIGKVIDISSAGLAVCYEGVQGWLTDSSEVDLLVVESKCYLARIPIKTISDVALPDSSSSPMKKERRCGLQFRHLSDHQAGVIEQFILKFTIP